MGVHWLRHLSSRGRFPPTSPWWGVAWWGWGVFFGGVVLFLSLNVLPDPFPIEDIKQTQEAFAVAEGIDAFEAAIRLNLGIREGEVSSHTGNWPAAIQISEGFPHPEKMWGKGWFFGEGFRLDAFFFLNLAQPLRVF